MRFKINWPPYFSLRKTLLVLLSAIVIGCDVYYGPRIFNSTASTVTLKIELQDKTQTVHLEPQSSISLGGARGGVRPKIKAVYLCDSSGKILKSLDLEDLQKTGFFKITDK